MRFDREFTKEEAAAYVPSEIRAIASDMEQLGLTQRVLLYERVQRERASELPALQDLARLEDLFERWAPAWVHDEARAYPVLRDGRGAMRALWGHAKYRRHE